MDYDELVQTQSGSPDAGGPRVIGWARYDSCIHVEGSATDLGGWGGWIEKGHRWHDYLANLDDRKKPYFEALRRDIVARKIRESGLWHQCESEGVPVFDDGSVVCFSQRAWGDLMAAIWSTEENCDYQYLDFYMDGFVPPRPQE
jgi:hypothetical protein